MIALITPTGNRQRQINLCSLWMTHQTYDGKVLWVIVDDGEKQTTSFLKDFEKTNWETVVLRPEPFWKDGENTQKRNILAGIEYIEKRTDIKSVFIIEDDDYYAKGYLETMVYMLDIYPMVGIEKTIYYNLEVEKYRVMTNNNHGSLFETGFHFKYLPILKKACMNRAKMIDIIFWATVRKVDRHTKLIAFPNTMRLTYGIKGMVGRSGIGVGHDTVWWQKLGVFAPLKALIGADAHYYEKS